MKLVNLYEREEKSETASVALPKIASYIGGQLGSQLTKVISHEHYHNSAGTGHGVRYVINGTPRCIRFNWSSPSEMGKLTRMKSIDVFNGKSSDPSFTIKTDGISILQALPVVINLLQHPTLGKFQAFPADPKQVLSASEDVSEAARATHQEKIYPDTKAGIKDYLRDNVSKQYVKLLDDPKTRYKMDQWVHGVWAVDFAPGTRFIVYLAGYKDPHGKVREYNDFESGETPDKEKIGESFIVEVKAGSFTAAQALDDFLHKLSSGKSFTRSEFASNYHINNVGIFDTIVSSFKNRIRLDGKRVSLANNKNLDTLKDTILSKAGIVEVVKGGSKETYLKSDKEEEVEKDDSPKVPFGDTLKHIEQLVGALIKGPVKSIFIAGKSGVGKTQTVERTLHQHGLTDGSGYFKNTGTASAAGVYLLLFHHRNDIVLFDDSDGALSDIDARNLIKAATDNKSVRKMVWNKKSSFIYDADDPNAAEYEKDMSMAPNHYDFKGRVIFISNLPLKKLDPDGALRNRAFIINVDPSSDELSTYLDKILKDIPIRDGRDLSLEERKKVLDVVRKSRRGDPTPRKLARALELAASHWDSNWEELVNLYA